MYSILDDRGNKIGVPIKASALVSRPTMKKLQGKFQANDQFRPIYKERLTKVIDSFFHATDCHTRVTFCDYLNSYAINPVFRENRDGRVYALTVHKSQGSEFGKVFLVIPNPCLLLTREMLYTALTRQKEKVILLFQGNIFDIKELASPLKSDALKRITNLFVKPELVEVGGQYLEKNLIHQASDGKMLRSKSELLIYQRLIDKKLQPLYEKTLTIKEVDKLPDFTIENEESGEVFYWEHCGMMHDAEYRQRWNEKYNWYRSNEILPAEEGGRKNGTLIITEDKIHKMEDGSMRGGISVKEIANKIKSSFGI